MSSSIPKKGELVINPKTSRPVKVGSRTWVNLVKEGIFENRYCDDNVVSENAQPLEPDTQAVKGRGKYAGKIVKRKKQPNHNDYTLKRSQSVEPKEPEPEYDSETDECSYQDMEERLQNMMMSEMEVERPKKPAAKKFPINRGRGRPIGSKAQPEYYQETETPEYDSYEDE
jgi:hypothetical protein